MLLDYYSLLYGSSGSLNKRALGLTVLAGALAYKEFVGSDIGSGLPILQLRSDNKILLTHSSSSSGANVALASFGTTVATSSNNGGGSGYGSPYGDPRNLNDGNRNWSNVGNSPSYPGGFWADGNENGYPKVVLLTFPTPQPLNLINIFNACDSSGSSNAPTAPDQPIPSGGVGYPTAFTVEVYNGTSWVTVGNVSGVYTLWKQFSFTTIPAATQVRYTITAVDGSGADAPYRYARVAEIECYGPSGYTYPASIGGSAPVNVALSSNGAIASATATNYGSTSNGYTPAAAIDGRRAAPNWGAGNTTANGNGWDTYTYPMPQTLTVTFAAAYTINQIDVITLQDGITTPTDPVLNVTTFSTYGATAYDVQVLVGGTWTTVGSVTGNNIVWRRFTFTAVLATAFRVTVYHSADSDSSARLVEVEAYTAASSGMTLTPLVREGVKLRPLSSTETLLT